MEPIDGIYAAYLSGRVGRGFAILLFNKGRVTGADALGIQFDGSYVEREGGNVSVEMAVNAPPNIQLVQGGLTGHDGDQYTVALDLPPDFPTADYIPIATKYGPINARIRRLRGLDG